MLGGIGVYYMKSIKGGDFAKVSDEAIGCLQMNYLDKITGNMCEGARQRIFSDYFKSFA